jgi:hypothetical protein
VSPYIRKNVTNFTMKIFMSGLYLSSLWLIVACETTKSSSFYVKARNSEELKLHAFERCGRKYKVLTYEDDTVRIECLGEKD